MGVENTAGLLLALGTKCLDDTVLVENTGMRMHVHTHICTHSLSTTELELLSYLVQFIALITTGLCIHSILNTVQLSRKVIVRP